eukprot:CAMPEP_0114574842 /NCGR_PEP_ID=MMETSP0114-20121206/19617_1 /TAXON_ID=31324 /ORGANISM="Goniomonas sp, Strain m" /LENGTH=283 /DNA_ID=CAMNT_0001762299 /DNA_START=60 /DNA_END=911 /DNA_ORIENTATION=+
MATETRPTFKIALLQLAVGADKPANLENAAAKIKEAASNGAKVVVLPECFNCPYGNTFFPQYAEDVKSGDSPSAAMLASAAKDSKVFVVGGSIPERDGDQLFNTSLTFDPEGQCVGKHRKVHLFDIDIPGGICFKESETLTAGKDLTVIDMGFARIGVGICYDIRFPELAQIYRHKHGCDLLVYPGAFNMTTGPKHWELLQRARAVDNQLYVAAVSPARDSSAGYVAWGHSTLVGPWGDVLATTEDAATIVYADVDLAAVTQVRAQVPTSLQRRTDLYDVVAK